jgi:hypothetical protein
MSMAVKLMLDCRGGGTSERKNASQTTAADLGKRFDAHADCGRGLYDGSLLWFELRGNEATEQGVAADG